MEEKATNTSVLMDKLKELNELEIKKSKVLATIFQKSTQEIVDKKIQSLKTFFEEQLKFYNQKAENYNEIYQEILTKYQEQLQQIIEPYNQLYINLYLELQETECNFKIAITNLKKSYEIKEEIWNKVSQDIIEEYDRKINACKQKKSNYDCLIEECKKALNHCAIDMEKKINSLFQDKSSQILLKEENSFTKFFQKIKNVFTGKAKFIAYVIEPIQVELDMLENKLPDVSNQIYQQTITMVAKMKQAKARTNEIFDNMI